MITDRTTDGHLRNGLRTDEDFGWACLAGVNRKLLAADLILMGTGAAAADVRVVCCGRRARGQAISERGDAV